jgi:hypothetical protein
VTPEQSNEQDAHEKDAEQEAQSQANEQAARDQDHMEFDLGDGIERDQELER